MLGLYTNLHQSPAVEPEIATLDLEPFHLLEIAGRRALSGILWILANTVEEHQRELVGCQKSSVREARHSEKTKKTRLPSKNLERMCQTISNCGSFVLQYVVQRASSPCLKQLNVNQLG